MEISKNSITTKLYRWFYSISANKLPNNLCPYFWKTVIMYILIIPISLIVSPAIILEIIQKDNLDNNTLEQRFLISLFIYVILFVILLMLSPIIYYFNQSPESIWYGLKKGGYIMWTIVTFIFLCVMGSKLYDKKKEVEEDPFGEKLVKKSKPNIITVFIKAKYKKYCPQITWEN